MVLGLSVVAEIDVEVFSSIDPLGEIPFLLSKPKSSSGKNGRRVLFNGGGSTFTCSVVGSVVFDAPFVPFLEMKEDEGDGDVLPIFVKTISAAPSPRPPIVAASATTVGVDRGGGGGEETTDPFLTPVRIRAFSRTALTRRRT